jgi:hypothetical protein
MAREYSTEAEAAKNSDEFSYVDMVEIQLPWKPGDVPPIIIRAAASPISANSSFDVAHFIYSAFVGALGRVPTVAEDADWQEDLEAAFEAEILLSTAVSLIQNLFLSDEYDDRMRTDTQFVEDLYNAYLGRVSDPEGKAFWTQLVIDTSRDAVRDNFEGSDEFEHRVEGLFGNVTYDSTLREPGDIAIAEGVSSTDSISFSLTNRDNTYSTLFTESARRLYPAPAVYKRAILTANGYEVDDLIIGFANFNTTDPQNAQITIFTEMSRTGIDVVEEETQRCANTYKGPGCDSPDESPTCSLIHNDAVNGCASKAPALILIDSSPPNNQPSFRGTPSTIVSELATVGLTNTDVGPSGFPIDELDPSDPRLRNYRMLMP